MKKKQNKNKTSGKLTQKFEMWQASPEGFGRNPKHLSPRKSCYVKKVPAKVVDATVKAHHHEGLNEGFGGEA